MNNQPDGRLVREAQEHLDEAMASVEAYGRGLVEQSRLIPSTPKLAKASDLPYCFPNKEEEQVQPVKPKYVHKHNFPGKPSFEERVKAVTPETIAAMNHDLDMLNMRREATHARRMSWDDVLMVNSGRAHKKNRKGNGKGIPPVISLDKLAEMELK